MKVTYARCAPDGSITLVGFWPDTDGWWTPHVRTFLAGGGGRFWMGGPIKVSDPYYQPECWIERAR